MTVPKKYESKSALVYPTVPLKRCPNARAVRHTPYPSHMWCGYGEVRTGPDTSAT